MPVISLIPMLIYRSFSSDDQRRWDLPRRRQIPWKIIAVAFMIAAAVIAALHSG